MRDALSLLDQVLALTGGDVSQEAVRRVLGLVEEDRYLELLDILNERRHGDVFTFVESLLDEGYDMVEFHRGLVDVIRLLLRLRLGQGEGGEGLREDLRESMMEKAMAFSSGDLVRMLSQATELESTGSLRRSSHPRLLMEMLLLRLSYLDRTVELESLLRGLGGVPMAGAEGPTPVAPPTPKARASRPTAPPTSAPTGSPRPDPVPVVGPPEPEAPTQAGPVSLEAAWARVLDEPRNLPRGVVPFLRAATVGFPGEGTIHVSVVPGPGLERLHDPVVLRGLKDAIAAQTGVDPELRVVAEAPENGPPDRITEETVRDGRLRELVEGEPTLGEAVKELDLELLD